MNQTMLDSALAYAAIGWKVFPIYAPDDGPPDSPHRCSCGDDCGSPAKHPMTVNGLKDATADAEIIRGWWKRWPTASIGVATGAASGIVVLDNDPRHGGNESLEKVMDEFGELPETVEAKTGGGGSHYIFAHPGRYVKNSVGANGWVKMPGLDIRGDGGYIVAAPSLHICGAAYAWAQLASPHEISPAAMPQWLLDRMDRPAPKPAPTANSQNDKAAYWLGKYLAMANYGNRNDVGFKLAVQLRDNGFSEREAEGVLHNYALRIPPGEKPYRDSEAMQSVKSAYSALPREPAKNVSRPAHVQVTSKPADGASAELGKYLTDITSGAITNLQLPWPLLTKLTQAGWPGNTTMITSDPGVGKTFAILQCLTFWYGNDIPAAVFFVEKDRIFHSMRLLAQLEGNGNFVDHDWIFAHEKEVEVAKERNAGMIDELGKCIYSAPAERVTLQSILEWLRQMAAAGKRALVVDPITAVAAGAERWLKDEDFVIEAQRIVRAHNASLFITTHPPKGNRLGAPTLHNQAGGAAYSRFTDTNIWINRPLKPRRVEWVDRFHMRGQGTIEQFFQIHKARNGRGAGRELAMTFGEGLAYAEQGVVKREIKEMRMVQNEEEAA